MENVGRCTSRWQSVRSFRSVLVRKHTTTTLEPFDFFFSFLFSRSFYFLNSFVPTERDNEAKYLVSMCVRFQKFAASSYCDSLAPCVLCERLEFVPLSNYNFPSSVIPSIVSVLACIYIYMYICIHIHIYIYYFRFPLCPSSVASSFISFTFFFPFFNSFVIFLLNSIHVIRV